MSAALIIDDNPINQKVLQLYMKSYIDQIDWSLTASGGLEKLKLNRYDYVLIDVYLPDINGIDLAAHIKSLAELNDKYEYLIAITGDQTVETNTEAQRVFNHILIKPFTRNKLIRLLGNPEVKSDKQINLSAILPLLETHVDKAQFLSLLQKGLRHFYDQLKKPEVSGNLENLRALIHKVDPIFKMIDQTSLIDDVKKYYSLPDSTRAKTLAKIAENVIPLLQETKELSASMIKNVSEHT